MPTTIERTEPRISLNALTAYLTGTPTRRRSIITQQKRPQPVGMRYYQPAQEAIARFLTSPERSELDLVKALEMLHSAPITTEHDAHRWQSNIQAIESFSEFQDQVRRHGFEASLGGNHQPKLEFGGLSVSVRPDVILRGEFPRFGPAFGAIRLYFNKHEPLTESSARYTAAVLLVFLRQHHADRQPMPKATLIVDVFGKAVFEAPAALQRLINDVKAASEEIATM